MLLSKPLQKLVRSKLLLPPLFRNSLRLRHWLAIFGVLLSNTETNRTTEHLLKELTFFFISNLLSINYKYSIICKVILSAIGYQNRSMAMGLLERISFKILARINLFIWNILKWVWLKTILIVYLNRFHHEYNYALTLSLFNLHNYFYMTYWFVISHNSNGLH